MRKKERKWKIKEGQTDLSSKLIALTLTKLAHLLATCVAVWAQSTPRIFGRLSVCLFVRLSFQFSSSCPIFYTYIYFCIVIWTGYFPKSASVRAVNQASEPTGHWFESVWIFEWDFFCVLNFLLGRILESIGLPMSSSVPEYRAAWNGGATPV